MSARRVAALLLALLLALGLLSGCGSSDSEDEAGEGSGRTVRSDFGEVVSDGSAIYYWKYTLDSFDHEGLFCSYLKHADSQEQLIRNENGKETVLLEASANGKLCWADGRLFYETVNSGEPFHEVWVTDASGKEPEHVMDGMLRGVTEDGAHVFVIDSDDELSSVATGDLTETVLFDERCSYVDVRGETAVCYTTGSSGDDVEIDVYAVTPGSEPVKLAHAEEETMNGALIVAEHRFAEVDGEDWLYFSYGQIAGSGVFYQGGRIARVRLDGSGFEVVAGEDEFTNADFTVDSDGSVSVIDTYERVSEALYGGNTGWYQLDGGVYAINTDGGESIPLLDSEDYADFTGDLPDDGVIWVENAEVHGDWAYVRLTRNLRDPGGDLGWREGYTLDDGVLLRVKLGSGSVETLYTY